MERSLYKNEEIEFFQLDTESIFNCSYCGQMGHEAPVRSKAKRNLLKTYHPHCADAIIYRLKHGGPERFESQSITKVKPKEEAKDKTKLVVPVTESKTEAPVKKSFLRPVEDDELERKKNKLKAIMSDSLPEVLAEELEPIKEKEEAKPKAKIELSEDGKIFITHKYDANLVDKYHFLKQIKYNKDFKTWECSIKDADYETCRFFFKIFKEIPRFEWLISEDAFKAIKKRSDWHEKNMRESKEIKELKSKLDTDIDLSHMKLTPYPYQKVGISFLNKIEGVGMVGDTMGVGKCSTGKTMIYGSFGYLPIEQVFNQYAGKLAKTDKDGGQWFLPKIKLWTISINPQGKQVKNAISFLYKQAVDTKIKKIKLMDGSLIEITQPHKLLGLNGWTNEFRVGEFLKIPKNIKILNPKTIDSDLVYFMSWLISEGAESEQAHSFRITQNNYQTLVKVKNAITRYSKTKNIKINKANIWPDKKTYRFQINSKELENHLKSLGYIFGKRSAEKQIPNFILNSSDENITQFLQGYLEAEGSVGINQRIVEVTSASSVIMNQLTFLFKRKGIWLRSVPKQKMATNGLRIKRTYYTGIIGGTSLRTFQNEVGFEGKIKNKFLNEIIEGKEINDNVDVIPTLDIFIPLSKELGLPEHHTGIQYVYKKTQNCSRTSLSQIIEKLKDIYSGKTLKWYKTLGRSKWTDQVLEQYSKIDYSFLKENIELLEHRLFSNSNYSKIKSVELVEFKGDVFDITVENDHNYIANNMYSHNTAQAIGYTSYNKLHTVVVCPASLKYNWKKEIEKFTDKTVAILSEFDETLLNPKNKMADYVIVNYEQLEKYDKYLSKAKFDCVILDESQYIMNLQAKRTKAVFKYFKKCKHRLCLSGTPIKNRPLEFYAQLKFLRPDQFSNKMKYALRYCDAKETPFGWDLRGSSNLDELNRKIAPFYIRRLKHEVLKDLPPKTVTVLDLEMGVTEKAQYQKIQREFERVMSDNLKVHGNTYQDRRIDGAHLAKLVELKQYCSQIKVARVVEFVKEFVESSENRKIIVFSQFIHTQKALRDAFPGISVSLLGEDSAEKRDDAVERFQKDPKIRVFVGSTIAAGVGLTLTAADTVVFADLMWSPADHEQAADRIHRIGQENPCFIYYMVFKDTIEAMIWQVIGYKLSVLSKTLDGKELKDVQPDVVKMVFSDMLNKFKSNLPKSKI